MAAVLQGGDFILGGAVGELEGRLADYAGVAQAITVANGTDALQIALMAMDVGAGDAVFVPPFTFAAHRRGRRPDGGHAGLRRYRRHDLYDGSAAA